MTDEELAKIRERVEAATPAPLPLDIFAPLDVPVEQVEANLRFVYAAYADMKALLAEVERLQEERDAYAIHFAHLRDKNAALREIADDALTSSVYYDHVNYEARCIWPFCDARRPSPIAVYDVDHVATCPVTKARTLLADKET